MPVKKLLSTFLSILLIFFSVATKGQLDTSQVNNLFEMDLSELMNQKVITVSKFVQSSAEAASSVGVVTAEEIRQYGYRTLGEVLNSQRGMYTSNDKNYTYVGSRGFGRPSDYNNRLIIMIDGHILNEIVYGSSFMGNDLALNLDNVERIEIIRGPGASVYGSGAMLNIINLIMKKGIETSGVNISLATGSYGKNEISAIYGDKIKDTDISFSAKGGLYDGEDYYFSELDDPATNSGISKRMDWEKYIGMETGITNNNLKISGAFMSRSKGIPTGAYNTDLTGKVQSLDTRYFGEMSYRLPVKTNSSLYLRTYLDGYHYAGSYPSQGVASYDASDGRWGGAELQYYLKAGNSNTITAGAEYKYASRSDYREWDDDTTYFDHNYPFSLFSFYAQDQVRIADGLNFTAALRFDKNSEFKPAFSPRLALVYKYSPLSSVKILYSEAFRVPTLYESKYDSYGVHINNPAIRSERIRATEIAWLHKLQSSVYGTLSVYNFLIYNLIDQVIDEDTGLTTFRNVGKASGHGIEYEFKYKSQANRNMAFLNFALQETIDKYTNKTLSNSPAFMLSSGSSLGISEYLNIVPEFIFETGRKTLGGNTTNNLYLFNLGLNSETFLRHFTASVKIRNIFNTKNYVPGGYEHIQDVIIQDSRNIYLRLSATF